jgi:hypothetical protein
VREEGHEGELLGQHRRLRDEPHAVVPVPLDGQREDAAVSHADLLTLTLTLTLASPSPSPNSNPSPSPNSNPNPNPNPNQVSQADLLE